jgi:DNA repair photolyase
MGVSNPIYVPKGPAREYGELALNIYTGCPHRCLYCYVPSVLRVPREMFHTNVAPREGIVEATKRQLEKEKIMGKTIFLCFTCDPYPRGYDTSITREIITAIKNSDNFVNILTKNPNAALRDIDLFDCSDDLQTRDLLGTTIDGSENNLLIEAKLESLHCAWRKGADTWISFEPIMDVDAILNILGKGHPALKFAKLKFGKLNYVKNDISWHKAAEAITSICKNKRYKYTLKKGLLKELER